MQIRFDLDVPRSFGNPVLLSKECITLLTVEVPEEPCTIEFDVRGKGKLRLGLFTEALDQSGRECQERQTVALKGAAGCYVLGVEDEGCWQLEKFDNAVEEERSK